VSAERVWKCVLIVVSVFVSLVTVVLLLEARLVVEAEAEVAPANAPPDGMSFVYRFDPISETFVFTYPLPTYNANPWDVVVVPGVGCQEVWFTEAGADRIGRLTYTDTNDYVFREYTLSAGSRPLSLVSGGGFIWFTESGRDQIGRLDPNTGEVDEFNTTAGSYPAGLDYASDGSIWFTQRMADRIAHLVVTDTQDYAITEYFTSSLSGSRPYGIVVDGANVFFAQTNNDRVTRFEMSSNRWIHLHDPVVPGIPDEPYAVALDGFGKVWATERVGNRVSLYRFFETSPLIVPYNVTPTNSLPTDLAVLDDEIWFTQWGAGRIGRLVPGEGFQYFSMPLLGLAPTGIATEVNGGIWVLASAPHKAYLPMVSRCNNASIPPLGVQFYGALNSGSGFDQIVDAGTRWIRLPLSWASIEPNNTTPDSYDWSGLDSSVDKAAQADVNAILTIAGQPSWAATYGQGPVTDTADLVEFIGALVERYDGDGVDDAPGSPIVQYFELYNEPDNTDIGYALSGGWGYWGHNGEGYAELLLALYPAVKAASPRANLVFGGLALDWFEPDGPFDPLFLDEVLAACQGKKCFDLMNFHYYPLFRANWEFYGRDIIGKSNYVRQRLAIYGYEDVPMLCTETGWPANASWGSDELQSRYVVKTNIRGMEAGLKAVVWFWAREGASAGGHGLLDDNLQPRQSYWAFQTMATMLDGKTYQRSLTVAEAGFSQIEGYVFEDCGQRVDVVWTEDDTWFDPEDDPVLPLTVRANTLRVVDKIGEEMVCNDGDDGSVDGLITILVSGSPLYLEYNP